MRRWIPIGAAAVVFVLSFAMLQPEPSKRVVVATAELPAGWTIRAEDVEVREVPRRLAPTDALTDPAQAVGKILRLARAAGDILRESALGAPVQLATDERAIGLRVSDASGLAGTLQPGTPVGVVAVIFPETGSGAFSKVTIEGLRVLYVSPEFSAYVPESPQAGAQTGISISSLRQRRQEGTVVLAVPTAPMPVRYALPDGGEEMRTVNALELLAALNAAQNAAISLYVMPEKANAFVSAGLFLEDLLPSEAITQTRSLSR